MLEADQVVRNQGKTWPLKLHTVRRTSLEFARHPPDAPILVVKHVHREIAWLSQNAMGEERRLSHRKYHPRPVLDPPSSP